MTKLTAPMPRVTKTPIFLCEGDNSLCGRTATTEWTQVDEDGSLYYTFRCNDHRMSGSDFIARPTEYGEKLMQEQAPRFVPSDDNDLFYESLMICPNDGESITDPDRVYWGLDGRPYHSSDCANEMSYITDADFCVLRLED